MAAPLVSAFLAGLLRHPGPRRAARASAAIFTALLPFAVVGEVDALSLIFCVLVCVLSAAATIFSIGSFPVDWGVGKAAWSRKPVYFVLLGAFTSAMLVAVLADNFATLWLGISATTVATAFLVGFNGESAALEAAWKYLVLCSVGLALALLGIFCLAHAVSAAGLRSGDTTTWSLIARRPVVVDLGITRFAFALMFIGFGTKAGLVPMHAWLPDAHSKAPAPISALLSGLLTTCASYGVIRTLGVASVLGAGDLFRAFLMWFGAISIFIAGLLMLSQRDLKRFLAYSTIEHMGIVALGLGFGAPWGTLGALFHLIAHAFVKPGAFFATGLLQREYGTTQLGALHGVLRKGATGHFMLSSLTGLAGMPPFPLFFSELVIMYAGVRAHAWGPLIAGMIGLLLAFVAITRVALDMLAGTLRAGDALREKKPADRMEITATAFVLACACAIGVTPWIPFGAHWFALGRILEYLR